jgi:hypothetical protein
VTVPVNCDGTRQHSQQDSLAALKAPPGNMPRQIDLTGAPRRMTVQGPLAVPIGGPHA